MDVYDKEETSPTTSFDVDIILFFPLLFQKKYKLRIDFTIWVNKTKRSGTQHEHFEVGPASDGCVQLSSSSNK